MKADETLLQEIIEGKPANIEVVEAINSSKYASLSFNQGAIKGDIHIETLKLKALQKLSIQRTSPYHSADSVITLDRTTSVDNLAAINSKTGQTYVLDQDTPIEEGEQFQVVIVPYEIIKDSNSNLFNPRLTNKAGETIDTIALVRLENGKPTNKIVGTIPDKVFYYTNEKGEKVDFYLPNSRDINPDFDMKWIGNADRKALQDKINLLKEIKNANGDVVKVTNGYLRFTNGESINLKNAEEINRLQQSAKISVYQKIYDNKEIKYTRFEFENDIWVEKETTTNVLDDVRRYSNSIVFDYNNGKQSVVSVDVDDRQEFKYLQEIFKQVEESNGTNHEIFITINSDKISQNVFIDRNTKGDKTGIKIISTDGNENVTDAFKWFGTKEFDDMREMINSLEADEAVAYFKKFMNEKLAATPYQIYTISFNRGVAAMAQELNEGKYSIPNMQGKTKVVEVIKVNEVANDKSNEVQKDFSGFDNIDGLAIPAAEYLLRSGMNHKFATDYFLKALSGIFLKAGNKIENIRNAYARQLADLKETDLAEFIKKEGLYNEIIGKVRDVIKEAYNSQEVLDIFGKVLEYPHGQPNKEGSEIETRMQEINFSENPFDENEVNENESFNIDFQEETTLDEKIAAYEEKKKNETYSIESIAKFLEDNPNLSVENIVELNKMIEWAKEQGNKRLAKSLESKLPKIEERNINYDRQKELNEIVEPETPKTVPFKDEKIFIEEINKHSSKKLYNILKQYIGKVIKINDTYCLIENDTFGGEDKISIDIHFGKMGEPGIMKTISIFAEDGRISISSDISDTFIDNIKSIELVVGNKQDIKKAIDSFDKLRRNQKRAAINKKYDDLDNKKKTHLSRKQHEISHADAVKLFQEYFPNSAISLEDVTQVLGKLSYLPNSIVYGVYDGIVRLRQAGVSIDTPLFEGFRLVFNALITDKRKADILNEAKIKYFLGVHKEEKADILREFQRTYTPTNSKGEYIFQGKELEDYYLETMLAREFIKKSKDNKPKSFIQRFFDLLKSFLGMNKADKLFNAILNKEFANIPFSQKDNQKTIKTMLEVGSQTTETNRDLLPSQDSYRIANRIFAYMSRKVMSFEQALQATRDYYENLLPLAKGETEDKIISIIDAISETDYFGKPSQVGLDNIEILRKEVNVRKAMLSFDPDKVEEDMLEIEDEAHIRSDNFNQTIRELGGELSASKKFKEYLSTILYVQDEFELFNDETEMNNFGKDKLLIPVDFIQSYGYMLRLCAGKNRDEILPILNLMKDTTPELKAIVEQINRDTEVKPNEIKEIDSTILPMILSNLERNTVEGMIAFIDKKVDRYDVISANTEGIESSQINKWASEYETTHRGTDAAKKLNVELANMYEVIGVRKTKIDKRHVDKLYKLLKDFGFQVSKPYCAWCLDNISGKKGEVDEKFNLTNDNNILSKDNRTRIFGTLERRENLEGSENLEHLFVNEDIETTDKDIAEGQNRRLKKIAFANSIFDPTVKNNSYKSAENKSMYDIIARMFIGDFANVLAKLNKVGKKGNPESKIQSEIEDKTVYQVFKEKFFAKPKGQRKAFLQLPTSQAFLNEIFNLVAPNVENSIAAMEDYKDVFTALGEFILYNDMNFYTKDFKLAFINGMKETSGKVVEGTYIESEKSRNKKGVTFNKSDAFEKSLTLVTMWMNNWYNPVVSAGSSMQFIFQGNKKTRLKTEGALKETKRILVNWFEQEVDRIDRSLKEEFKEISIDKYENKSKNFFEYDSFIKSLANNKDLKFISDAFGKKGSDNDKKKFIFAYQNDANTKKLVDEAIFNFHSELANKFVKETLFILDKEIPTSLVKNEKGSVIHKDNETALREMYFDTLINNTSFGIALMGDKTMSFKNYIDINKRIKSAIGGGTSAQGKRNIVAQGMKTIKKKLGIDEFDIDKEFYDSKGEDYPIRNEETDGTDAESYQTVDSHAEFYVETNGKLTKQVKDIYEMINWGIEPTQEWWTILDANNAALQKRKMFYNDSMTLIKTSVNTLTWQECSWWNESTQKQLNGLNQVEQLAKIKELTNGDINKLFSLRQINPARQDYATLLQYMLSNKIDYVYHDSASKKMQRRINAKNFNELDAKDKHYLNPQYWKEQVATDGVKMEIIDGTQKMQLIWSEQNGNINVNINGSNVNMNTITKEYAQLLAARIDNEYENVRKKFLENGEDFNIEELRTAMIKSLEKSGATMQTMKFFKEANLNLPHIVEKAESMFFSTMSHILSHKKPGTAAALASPQIYNVLRATSQIKLSNGSIINQNDVISSETFRKFEAEIGANYAVSRLRHGVPVNKTNVIPKDVNTREVRDVLSNRVKELFKIENDIRNNKGYQKKLDDAALKANQQGRTNTEYSIKELIEDMRKNEPSFVESEKERQLLQSILIIMLSTEDGVKEGKEKALVKLEENINKYNKEYAVSHYYAEIILPSNHPALAFMKDGFIPAEFAEMVGIRIPTQDKHSMLSMRVVDIIPAYKGATVVLPLETILLSGADFDIDKEYIYWFDGYQSKNGWKKYGNYKNEDELYSEYVRTNMYKDFNKSELIALMKTHALGEYIEELENNNYLSEDDIDKLVEKYTEMPNFAKDMIRMRKDIVKSGKLYNQMLQRMEQNQKGIWKDRIVTNEHENNNDLLELEIVMVHNNGNNDRAYKAAEMKIVNAAVASKMILIEKERQRVAEYFGMKLTDTLSKENEIVEKGFDSLDIKEQLKKINEFVEQKLYINVYGNHSPLDILTAYHNNDVGAANIGVWALANVINQVITASGISKIKIDEHGNLMLGKVRINDIISSFLSSATDNDKEQHAAILNLDTTNCGIVFDLMWRLGLHPEVALAIVDNNGVQNITDIAKTKEMLLTLHPTLAGMTFNGMEQVDMIIGIMDGSLGEMSEELLKTGKTGQEYTLSMTKLASLIKGFKPTISDNYEIVEALEILEKGIKTEKGYVKPYDGLPILMSIPYIKSEIENFHNVYDKLTPKVFLTRNPLLLNTLHKAMNSFKNMNFAENRNKLHRDMLSYVILNVIKNDKQGIIAKYSMIAGSENFLTPAITMVKAELTSRFSAKNEYNPLVKGLQSKKITYKFGELERQTLYTVNLNTWLKAVRFLDEKMQNEFERFDVRSHALDKIVDSDNLEETIKNLSEDELMGTLAKLIYIQAVTKDGLQFKSGSPAKLLPPRVFKSMNSLLNELTNATKNREEIFKNVIGKSTTATMVSFIRNFAADTTNSGVLITKGKDNFIGLNNEGKYIINADNETLQKAKFNFKDGKLVYPFGINYSVGKADNRTEIRLIMSAKSVADILADKDVIPTYESVVTKGTKEVVGYRNDDIKQGVDIPTRFLNIKTVQETQAKEISSQQKGNYTFTYKDKSIPTEFQLSLDQENALKELIDFAQSDEKRIVLQGSAGTGKTSIIGYLQQYLKEQFLYTAPTHAATVELAFGTMKTGNKVLPSTVASSFKQDADGEFNLSNKAQQKIGFGRIIVVDETTMLNKKDYDKIKSISEKGKYKVIFIGDKKQIPEVSTNNENKDISKAFTENKAINLDVIHRTSNENIKSILQKVRDSINFQLYKLKENTENVKFFDNDVDFKGKLREVVTANPQNTDYIAYTNSAVSAMNKLIREQIFGRTGIIQVGDIVMGYLGYSSKQIEKGNLANSVSYKVEKVNKTKNGYELELSSEKLDILRNKGFSEIKEFSRTTVLPLSDNEVLQNDFNQNVYDENNRELSNDFGQLYSTLQKAIADKRYWSDFYSMQEGIAKKMANIDLAEDYIYNYKTDKMENYNKSKPSDVHKGLYGSNATNFIVEKGIDFGHAITIHKSQGRTTKNVFFDANTIIKSDIKIFENDKQISTERQSLGYVGLSRASENLYVNMGWVDFETVDNVSSLQQKDETQKYKIGEIDFQEEQSSGYAERTKKNASVDATIALAVDFSTAGEKLTKSSVESQGKKYIPIDAKSLEVTEERVNKIVDILNSIPNKKTDLFEDVQQGITLNIAGNGIYTMKYSQQQVDDFTYQLLKAVIESPKLNKKISLIRSGGQTGFDEAGAKAGLKLGIPTLVLAPKGWAFRNVNNKDIYNEAQFKARFDNIEQVPKEKSPTEIAQEIKSNQQKMVEVFENEDFDNENIVSEISDSDLKKLDFSREYWNTLSEEEQNEIKKCHL